MPTVYGWANVTYTPAMVSSELNGCRSRVVRAGDVVRDMENYGFMFSKVDNLDTSLPHLTRDGDRNHRIIHSQADRGEKVTTTTTSGWKIKGDNKLKKIIKLYCTLLSDY